MQKFTKGPGVYRQETDLSEVIAPASTSVGALVGNAAMGPVNQRVLLATDKEFVDIFGAPDNIKWGIAGYASVEFLAESNSLYFVRASNGTEQYANVTVVSAGNLSSQTILATSSTALVSVAGYEDGNKANNIYNLEQSNPGASGFFLIGAIGPGLDGANTAIQVVTSAGGEGGFEWRYNYDAVTTTAGGTISRQVFKINVFRKTSDDADFSSVSGSPVETWYVSLQLVKDGTGKSLYITDVINGNSKYIYVKVKGATAGAGERPTWGLPYYTTAGTVFALSGAGTADYTGEHTAANIGSAYTLFSNKESSTINILINPYPIADYSINVANIVGNQRMDSIAVVQAGDSVTKTVAGIQTDTTYPTYPSYVAIYAGYSLYYDKYNDRNIYIPNCIYGAALMARTDRVANTWDAPAGLNRGILPVNGQNVLWSADQIGTLYDSNINCVKRIPGAGYIMWGQKTAQQKKSALDRINVRRLLLYIENSVEPTLQYFLFENNTDKTRSRVYGIVDSFMKQVLAGGGVTKYQVVCDATNNPQSVIDNNQLNVDIYVQPARSIEYIKLQTIITKTGVNFAEVLV